MDEKPTTSNASSTDPVVEEINVDNEVLNESLEIFAKTYNLTAQNVKNILYHVIKNPQTFATLFGKDPEAITSLRMTRSRQKELERIAKVKLGIELKPVNAARTFLDINYDDNDEDDMDYRPDETENCDGDDGNESDFPESNADWGELVEDEEEMDQRDGEEMPVELLTSVDDPEYLKFLKSLTAPAVDNDDDLDDDDEFNIIQQEMDVIEEEEFRMDRTTKIPRSKSPFQGWELEALRQDWITADADKPPPKKRHCDPSMILEPMYSSEQLAQSKSNRIPQHTTSVNLNESGDSGSLNPEDLAENLFRPNTYALTTDVGEGEIIELYSSIPSTSETDVSLSCTLLCDNVTFMTEELSTIRVQMEKQVQLLTQGIIGSYEIPELTSMRNRLIEMMEELDYEMYSRGEDSCFYVPILQDAIFSCHDITKCQETDIPAEMKSTYYLAPKNNIMWVLARCKAFKYPQLVSDVRMQHFPTPHSPFLPSEQTLLALALYQLFHVKHSSWNNAHGKYQLISNYFLPNKTVNQIRYHLKNLRASSSRSPIHAVIMEVQCTGQLKAEFLLDNEGRNAQSVPPLMWPLRLQPEWLKKLGTMFASGQVRFDLEPREVSQSESHEEAQAVLLETYMGNETISSQRVRTISSGTQCNSLSEVDLDDDNSMQGPQLDYGNVNELACEVAIASEEVSNDVFDFAKSVQNDAGPSAVPADTTKQKSRRKLRVEKCMERLYNKKAREESLFAVVEAVSHDVKQRLFMHQDKLKEIQTIISNKDLSATEILKRLSSILCGEQHAHVLALIASLVPDEAFTPELPISNDLRRVAYKKALEMLVNSHTYLMGCRSKQSVRNVFKNIREATERASSEEIANRLKHHFGTRDSDPLWRVLRTQIPHEKFDERVEDWQYESVDMDNIPDGSLDTANDSLKFENVNLPYKCDPHDRGRLRLRHGRLTMQYNGKLKTVQITPYL